MNSSPDISVPENPSKTEAGLRGSERFWKHSLLLGFIFAATHFLPQVALHQSLKDKIDNQTAIVYDSGKYIPASVRMGQNYLEASPQPRTITREVNEQMLQFQNNEHQAIERTELKRNLIKSVVADSRLGIPKEEQPLWVNRMLLNTAKRSYPNQTYMTPEELLRNPAVLKNLEEKNIPKASIEEAKFYITRFKAAVEIFSAKQVIPPQTKA